MRTLKLGSLLFLLAFAVQPAFADKHASNAQTLADIQDRLYHAQVLQHGQVQAAYENGVVTLTGSVDNLGTKLDAERAARKAEGVVQVVNNVEVRADDATARQMLQQARKEIVTYYAYGIFDNITLQAQGDKLTVSGQVTQPFKKQDIGNFLTRVRGVATVENNLEVLPVSLFDDQLRLAVARAIYGDPFFLQYGNQPLPPIHIIVKNGDVTLEGVVATPLDRTKAEMAARFAGLSFSVANNLRLDRA